MKKSKFWKLNIKNKGILLIALISILAISAPVITRAETNIL